MAYPASRKYERYDPYDRTYKKWSIPEDWNGMGAGGFGIHAHTNGLPRFTRDEWVTMQKERRRGRQIDTANMGDEWNDLGPKVCFIQLYLTRWLTISRDGVLNMMTSGAMHTGKQITFAKA